MEREVWNFKCKKTVWTSQELARSFGQSGVNKKRELVVEPTNHIMCFSTLEIK